MHSHRIYARASDLRASFRRSPDLQPRLPGTPRGGRRKRVGGPSAGGDGGDLTAAQRRTHAYREKLQLQVFEVFARLLGGARALWLILHHYALARVKWPTNKCMQHARARELACSRTHRKREAPRRHTPHTRTYKLRTHVHRTPVYAIRKSEKLRVLMHAARSNTPALSEMGRTDAHP